MSEADPAVTEWIRQHARPATDLELLRDKASDATVVALGVSTRQSHELSTLQHRIVRFLVEQLGFRSLVLEGDETSSALLDEYVRGGSADPVAILAEARSFWRTAEILDLVRWLREHNERHPDDQVRVADGQPLDLAGDIEHQLAANTIKWHDRTGHKIAYWGGIAHTAVSSSAERWSGGRHLREHFGFGYVSLGLTFHHGTLPAVLPSPPAGFAETTLGNAGIDAYLLDLREDQPATVSSWLSAPAKTRLIGPHEHTMSGGSLATWFDVVGHVREVTPTGPLPSPA